MMKIVNRLSFFKSRGKPTKNIKYEQKNGLGNHLTKKEKPKKLYEYYVCDYCGEEIKIESKWENKTGGICKIPQTLSNIDTVLYLALCNKCVIPVEKEFEYKKEHQIEKESK